MNYKEQIKLIQDITGLTQEEIALKLDVTFAALNRWLNNKAIPRRTALKKINDLYTELVTKEKSEGNSLEIKKSFILNKRKNRKNVLKTILANPDIKDEFILHLTYNSNSIEGSTLSLNETAAIIFRNKTFGSKTAIEHIEAKNHQAALEYLFNYLRSHLKSKKEVINEKLILKLHAILLNGIHSDAGFYRRHAVRIVGSNVPTSNYVKVPYLMEDLCGQINLKSGKDLILHIAKVHSKFEQVHPFVDGNGRVGRLIMNAILLKENFPPAVIEQKKKHKYYTCLNKAQLKDDFADLEEFLLDAVVVGYRILEREEK